MVVVALKSSMWVKAPAATKSKAGFSVSIGCNKHMVVIVDSRCNQVSLSLVLMGMLSEMNEGCLKAFVQWCNHKRRLGLHHNILNQNLGCLRFKHCMVFISDIF